LDALPMQRVDDPERAGNAVKEWRRGGYRRGVGSNLECVGLAVPDREAMVRLVRSALGTAEILGRRDERVLYRWQDPSGVRLILATESNTVVDFLPSLAAEPGARLGDVRTVNPDVAVADVLDDNGEVVTKLAAAFEQQGMFGADPVAGRATIVALGVDATVHRSAEAFTASDASLLGDAESASEPPAHFLERGWHWPPRMAPESFISYGLFNVGESAEPYARLSGVVLGAETRTVAATGQRFVAARVRCVGFEAEVCLPAGEGTVAPPPGSVIAGTVFLVASLPDLPLRQGVRARKPRRWWHR
jgi:hypothetical protein